MIGRISEVDHRVSGAVCPWCGKDADAMNGMDTDSRPPRQAAETRRPDPEPPANEPGTPPPPQTGRVQFEV